MFDGMSRATCLEAPSVSKDYILITLLLYPSLIPLLYSCPSSNIPIDPSNVPTIYSILQETLCQSNTIVFVFLLSFYLTDKLSVSRFTTLLQVHRYLRHMQPLPLLKATHHQLHEADDLLQLTILISARKSLFIQVRYLPMTLLARENLCERKMCDTTRTVKKERKKVNESALKSKIWVHHFTR